MAEYSITLPDGTRVEAPTVTGALMMAHGLTTDTEPSATLGERKISLCELIDAWERKAQSSHLDPRTRAAYSDAAETLAVVRNGGSLTESP